MVITLDDLSFAVQDCVFMFMYLNKHSKLYFFQMRSGYERSIFEPLLPIILGRDVSGEVAAVGASVRSLSVGQEVFGAIHSTAVRGTYTDYSILSDK